MEIYFAPLKVKEVLISPGALTRAKAGAEQSDNIAVMLATDLLKSDSLVEGTYKIYAAPSEQTIIYEGNTGEWSNSNISVEIAVSADNTNAAYQMEIAIPWSGISGRPEVNENWGVNFELTNHDSGANSFYREVLSGNTEGRPSTWSGVQLIR